MVLTVMPCIVLGQPHLLGLSVALTVTALDLLASVGGTVNFLYLVGICSGSYSSGFGSHNLPIVADRFSGDQHVARTDRVCTHCGGTSVSTAVTDELHMIHECPVLQPLRIHVQYAALFTPDTDTMRSIFAQQDHIQVFKFVLNCLDFLKL